MKKFNRQMIVFMDFLCNILQRPDRIPEDYGVCFCVLYENGKIENFLLTVCPRRGIIYRHKKEGQRRPHLAREQRG